jgi:hypothetical protein
MGFLSGKGRLPSEDAEQPDREVDRMSHDKFTTNHQTKDDKQWNKMDLFHSFS